MSKPHAKKKRGRPRIDTAVLLLQNFKLPANDQAALHDESARQGMTAAIVLRKLVKGFIDRKYLIQLMLF